jgi:hypothetical protein
MGLVIKLFERNIYWLVLSLPFGPILPLCIKLFLQELLEGLLPFLWKLGLLIVVRVRATTINLASIIIDSCCKILLNNSIDLKKILFLFPITS